MLLDLALHGPRMSLVFRPYGHARDTACTFRFDAGAERLLGRTYGNSCPAVQGAPSATRGVLGGVASEREDPDLLTLAERAGGGRTHEGQTWLTGRTGGRTLGSWVW